MNKNTTGFTIVELLITIIVIAILATISVIAYSGIQQRAKNAARIAAGEQWVRTFQLYGAQEGAMPPSLGAASLDTRICLGKGFPTNSLGVAQCQNYPHPSVHQNNPREDDNATLMSELKAVTDVPTARPIPVTATSFGIVGPFAQRTTNERVLVTIVLDGAWAPGADCGGGWSSLWTNNIATSCIKTVQF